MSKPITRIKRDIAHIPNIRMSQTYCGKDFNEVENLDYRKLEYRECRHCRKALNKSLKELAETKIPESVISDLKNSFGAQVEEAQS